MHLSFSVLAAALALVAPAQASLLRRFREAIAAGADVRAALDAMLVAPEADAVLRRASEPSADVFERARASLRRTEQRFAKDQARLVPGCVASVVRDTLAMIDLLPSLRRAVDLVRLLGNDPPPTTSDVLGIVYDSRVPPRIAAGFVGLLSGPFAMYALERARDDINSEQATSLAELAAEGVHDGLRLLVVLAELVGAEVPATALGHDDRIRLEEERQLHGATLAALEA